MFVNNAAVDYMSYFMIILGVVTFLALQYLDAPYGRYNSSQWGPSLNGKVAWVLMESPSLSIPLGTFIYNMSVLPPETCALFTCFIVHYTNRTLVYPFMIRGGKRTSFAAFIFAVFFCLLNGTLQSSSLLLQAANGKNQSQLIFIAGITLFIVGMIINIHSDHILRNLRKPGETGYKIPKGGMFEYVSAANFLGEVIEWGGFALAAGSIAAFAFVFYSACNLVPRGFAHHRWYKEKFDSYPAERKVIVPFLI